ALSVHAMSMAASADAYERSVGDLARGVEGRVAAAGHTQRAADVASPVRNEWPTSGRHRGLADVWTSTRRGPTLAPWRISEPHVVVGVVQLSRMSLSD